MPQTFKIGLMLWALLALVSAGCATIDWAHDKAIKITSQPHEPDSPRAREGGPGDSVAPAEAVSTPTPAQAPAPALARANTRAQGQTASVQFGFDKSDLDQAAQTFLLLLVKKLRDNPKLTVELAGYTDSVGSKEYNLKLSQKRVEAVRRFLVQRGVDPARVRSVGFGQLPDNGKPDEQAQNRRVTVKVVAASD